MKKRLLLTTSTYPRWAGDSTTVFIPQFADQLIRKGWEVTILAPHALGALTEEHCPSLTVRRYRYVWPPRGETLAYDGGALTKIKKTPGYAIKLLLLVGSLLLWTWWLSRGKRAALVNAHWLIPQGCLAVVAAYLTGKRVVITIHGSDVFALNNRWLRRIKRFALKRADAVVVNSSATLAASRNLYDRPDYVVIPMGVDMHHFKPVPPSIKLRRRFDLGDFTVLFVGRLTEQKGVSYLIDALRQLKQQRIEFKALIVGDGPSRASLEAQTKANGLTKQVSFVGWVSHSKLVNFYSVADVFVGPSTTAGGKWQEALGLVFAEAQACGVPVIATDTGGIADVIKHNITGLLIPERSAVAISRQLQYLYNNPAIRKQLARNARDSMQSDFSWESVVDRYDRIFNELLL